MMTSAVTLCQQKCHSIVRQPFVNSQSRYLAITSLVYCEKGLEMFV